MASIGFLAVFWGLTRGQMICEEGQIVCLGRDSDYSEKNSLKYCNLVKTTQNSRWRMRQGKNRTAIRKKSLRAKRRRAGEFFKEGTSLRDLGEKSERAKEGERESRQSFCGSGRREGDFFLTQSSFADKSRRVKARERRAERGTRIKRL